MRSWNTANGYRIIQVLSGRSNAYLIEKGSTLILVDTGKKSSFDTLVRNIHSLNLSLDAISVLVLTHTHFDHCQSAGKIKERSHCQIIVSGAAASSIKNGYTPLPGGSFWATRLISRLGRWVGKRKFGYEPFEPDLFVGSKHVLADLGIEIIETKGHSNDSVSILVDHEIALVGDAMFGVFKNSIFPPFADDIQEMIQSWQRLLTTECNLFLSGHGKEIKRKLLQSEFEKFSLGD